MQEVTFGRYRLAAYQKTVRAFCQRLREFLPVARRPFFLDHLRRLSLEQLLLKQLREAGGVGVT